MNRDDVFEFICNYRRLSGKRKQKFLEEARLNSHDWLAIYKACCYTDLKIVAAKMAVETAMSLADWVPIAEVNGDPLLREKGMEEVAKLEITTEKDIDLLLKSSSAHLRSVGWWLDGKRRQSARVAPNGMWSNAC